jgi:ppGpp synthetase/RelA/SpoT-type nucleotidyltranferase
MEQIRIKCTFIIDIVHLVGIKQASGGVETIQPKQAKQHMLVAQALSLHYFQVSC